MLKNETVLEKTNALLIENLSKEYYINADKRIINALDSAKEFRVASRRFYGAPASGSKARFDKRHNEVIEYVFDKTKNNFKN